MSKKVIGIALDIKKIPYINGNEIIFTPGKQKIWYTSNTKSIEIPSYIKISDSILNSFMKRFMKKTKKRDILQFNYFTNQVAAQLKEIPYDEIIFENSQLKEKILPNFKNKNEYVIEDSMA